MSARMIPGHSSVSRGNTLKSETFVLDRSPVFGRIPAADNGLVTGSSPAGLANVGRAFDALAPGLFRIQRS
jgi:hypothetical protein